MTTKNKYAYRSRISEAKIRQIVKSFAVDLDASQIAEVVGLNRNARYLAAIKERIARRCAAELPVSGTVDASYFGAPLSLVLWKQWGILLLGLARRRDNVESL